MSTAQIFLVGALCSQAILCILVIWRSSGYLLQKSMLSALLISIMAHSLGPFKLLPAEFSWINSLLSNAVPGFFWFFCASLFNDHFRLHAWKVALVLFSMVVPVIRGSLPLSNPALSWLMRELPQLLEYLFLALALLVVAQHWSTDLIMTRRRLRVWFCGASGLYILFYILILGVFDGVSWFGSEQRALSSLVMLLITNTLILRLSPELFVAPPTFSSEPDPIKEPHKEHSTVEPPEQDPVLERLLALIEEEFIYREMGLSIGQLAVRLSFPEYRLRQTINTGLGYRNFNDFLNSYRVREAAQRLISTEEKHLPVLTIALDVGFRSLSSFNKTFKDHYKLPPTAYRREQLNKEAHEEPLKI